MSGNPERSIIHFADREKENKTTGSEISENHTASTFLESTNNSAIEHEILSEQFRNYFRISQALQKTLKRPKDIQICTHLLHNAEKLNDSKQLEVKRNNNIFLAYCLKILKWTSENQPLTLYKFWYRHIDTAQTANESHRWLEANKCYRASKRLEDGTIIVYSAVSADPSAGWQDGGLTFLAKIGYCSRN